MEGVIIVILLVALFVVVPIVSLVKVCAIQEHLRELERLLRCGAAVSLAGAARANGAPNRNSAACAKAEPVPPAKVEPVKCAGVQPNPPAGEIPSPRKEPPPAKPQPAEAQPAQPRSVEARPCPSPLSPPSGIELFFAKVGDWLAVRGDFAPRGMTREFAFATRWLVRVGVLLLTGSLVYFVKLSIDRGWMGPTGRVAAMLLWGAAGCAGGVWLVKRTRYGVIGHAVAALGVVALYLGFGLGHRAFDPPVIASPVFAFAALAGVTLAAGVMSACIPSPHIAVMALAGGYLVPLVAGRDSGFPLGLDLYLLVLNLGAFLVARRRRWSGLDFLAATLAYVMCFAWGAKHPGCGHAAVLVNFAFAATVHALYMTSVILGARFRGAAGNSLAWTGLALNACVLFGWVASVFRAGFSDRAAGLVILALVAAYALVATLAIRRGWADRPTVNILMVFALAFLAVAPLFLFDRAWCAVTWSAIAVAAAEGERRSGQRALGAMAYVILAAAAVANIAWLAPQSYLHLSRPALAGMSAGAYFAALALRLVRLWSLPVAAAWIARRNGFGWLRGATGILVFLFYTSEAWIFGATFLPAFRTGSVTVAWTALAFAGLFAGIVRRVTLVRKLALALLGVSVAKLLLVDTAHLATPSRVALFALTGVALLVGAFLYLKNQRLFADSDSADGKEEK